MPFTESCGEISILPALLAGWEDGSVAGLKSIGGFEAEIDWQDGYLGKAEIRSLLGNPCTVRANGTTKEYSPAIGEKVVINGI